MVWLSLVHLLPFHYLLSILFLILLIFCPLINLPSHWIAQSLSFLNIVRFKISRREGRLMVGLSSVASITLIQIFLILWLTLSSWSPVPTKFKEVDSLLSITSLWNEICELSIVVPPSVEHCVSSLRHLVHSNILGPLWVPSRLFFYYFVIFVDYYWRITYLHLTKDRSELCSLFKSFYHEINMQFVVSIKLFRSYNAREYFHTSLSTFFDDHGIIHQFACARTPCWGGVLRELMGVSIVISGWDNS